MSERRTWNTPLREPWNPVVAQILKGIDEHTRQHLATGDPWHAEQAATLRAYVRGLKDWIHRQEGRE